MTLCLNCQKEVEPTEGKRAKKYCSGSCRASHYQKTHPKREKQYVLMKTYKNLEEKYDALKKVVENLKGQVDFAHKPLVPNVPNEEAFHDPKLEAALKQPAKPLPQTLTKPVRDFNELKAEAATINTRTAREAFWIEVVANKRLTQGQKEMIRSKFPPLID